jgi:HAD superfamily hydrolase (TIGR01484 family)
MHNKFKLILATDLDGTFLEGTNQVKEVFYNELLRLRDHVMLIYVTGRTADVVEQFCKNGYLPNPHFIIADHGTHVIDGINFCQVEQLQNTIIQQWSNGHRKLKELLHNEVGIQLQPLNPPYRAAYYYDPAYLQNETLQKIMHAGFDAILSCDMYLDIVPRGVNKGSTLLNLLNDLDMSHESVITCGDSLNDLSLFQTGLKSIAVGNSEPKLITEIKALKNVYHSTLPGLLGIIDGLHFYEKIQLFKSMQYEGTTVTVQPQQALQAL